jgi:lipoyl-dependent peroxiredoxin
MTTLYTARATSTGSGRQGHVATDDGVLDADLSVPKGLGGAGGPGTNPEQLFAAGYAACFHSALQLVARKEKLRLTDTSVTAEVGIGAVGESFGLSVELIVAVPGVEKDTAQRLVEAAHQVCPYSNATRGNIDAVLRVA